MEGILALLGFIGLLLLSITEPEKIDDFETNY